MTYLPFVLFALHLFNKYLLNICCWSVNAQQKKEEEVVASALKMPPGHVPNYNPK